MISLFWDLANAENYTYETKYITLPVDHFSFANNETFKLRYLIKKDYWKSDGPIFFYTGNEGDINTFAQNTGFIWDIAPEFSALVVFAEHRYYGESLPFGNKSFTSPHYLGYLTSSQALADYVDLINSLQAENSKKIPVVAFGGSYGGMLAAWLRMKYPHIVIGSIAASAPILQFEGLTPCGAYNRIVTSDFRIAYTPDCAECIRKSWKEIRDLAATDAGKTWLSNEWKLCKPLKTQDNIDEFIDFLSEVYGNLAMINYPYSTNFLAPVPAYPVKVLCSKLQNSTMSGKVLVSAIRKAVSIYTNYTGYVKCLNIDNTADSNIGEQGWDFQACSEMVMPMCSDGTNDMFENIPWNFNKYSDKCFKKWGVRPKSQLAISEYGGKNIYAASNIVFSNGLLDPWSAGGVLHNISRSVLAVLIPEGAHHLDLRGANKYDPVSVVRARRFHKQMILTWIRDYYSSLTKYRL